MFRPGVLEHLTRLVRLDLGKNQISHLHPQVFLANTDMEVLLLDSNRVRSNIELTKTLLRRYIAKIDY